MTFGFTTIGLLNWIAMALLAAKLAATLLLLGRSEGFLLRTRLGAVLWWATKIAPLVALPCLIAAATLQGEVRDMWLYASFMIYAIVAVSIMVHRRRSRMTIHR